MSFYWSFSGAGHTSLTQPVAREYLPINHQLALRHGYTKPYLQMWFKHRRTARNRALNEFCHHFDGVHFEMREKFHMKNYELSSFSLSCSSTIKELSDSPRGAQLPSPFFSSTTLAYKCHFYNPATARPSGTQGPGISHDSQDPKELAKTIADHC